MCPNRAHEQGDEPSFNWFPGRLRIAALANSQAAVHLVGSTSLRADAGCGPSPDGGFQKTLQVVPSYHLDCDDGDGAGHGAGVVICNEAR